MSYRPSYILHCHPSAACAAARGITAQAVLTADGGLALSYTLDADLVGLTIPATGPTGPADRLWEHTCFEAFVGPAGSRAYREFNFSPAGQWAVYAFSGYRQRDESLLPPAQVPRITVRRLPDRLEMDVLLAPSLLPEAGGAAALQLGLSAVVESAGGSRSYWALVHPGAQPDFHHRNAFALTLALPDNNS